MSYALSPVRRIIAATIAMLLVAIGLTVAATPTASAVPVDDSKLIPEWRSVTLTNDVNGNGRPDVGDTVGYSMRYAMTGSATEATVDEITMRGNTYSPGTVYTAGTDRGLYGTMVVTAGQLDALGGGPHWPAGSVTYRIDGVSHTDVFPAPPALYTAPTPISVSTTFDMTENHGSVANQLVEGDTVKYVARITNTSAVNLDVTIAGPVTFALAPGAHFDLDGASRTVTYDDMVAGGVTFADASVGWAAGEMSGTVPVTVGTAPTEPIDASVTTDVSTVVHTSTGGAVALGDAVAGDVIDYTFSVRNDGNVVANYLQLARAAGPAVTGTISITTTGLALTQGVALPTPNFGAAYLTSFGGSWTSYKVTPADIERGYVDLDFAIQAAPSTAAFTINPGSYTHAVNKRIYLRTFTARASVTYTKAQLNDANGDGIGNEGETVTYRAVFENLSDQDLLIDSVNDLTDPYVSGPAAAAFVGTPVARGDQVAQEWDYTITSADETRGTLDAGLRVFYTGQADGTSKKRHDNAPTITTGVYVAPATTLDTTGTYVDDNLDGFPSIGETVTFTATVTNTGLWDLTGLAVGDAAGTDVTGLLPTFASTVAAGTSQTQTFTHSLTAADFARGSLWYGTEMTATGVPVTQSGTSVTLTGITFRAYETDLTAATEGGVDVCLPTGASTSLVTILDTIWVKPGACDSIGAADGHRVVAFSTPLELGVDTFAVTVPAAIHVGIHRLALYAPDGSLVGWKTVTVKDPIVFAAADDVASTGTDSLASTGTNSDEVRGLAGGAAALVLLGAAALFASTKRKRSSEI